MDKEKMYKLEDTLADVLERDNAAYGQHVYGEYHPSQVSGCPLKVFLNWMTDDETTLNSWLFQGSAVHYYLQETGLMTEALNDAGYHPVHTSYEVATQKEIGDGITITGKCDIHVGRNGDTTIFDIKYSSLPADSGHGRIYKYMSQANTYAHMFDADAYGLIMINSKSRDLCDDIAVMPGQMSEENWEIVKQKAHSIHEALDEYGWPEGERLPPDLLDNKKNEFWKEMMQFFDKKQCPSYEKECDWCSHSGYCPVKNGKLGGVKSLVP